MKVFQLLTLLLIFGLLLTTNSQAQKIYNPDADAKKDIEHAIQSAKKSDKHVFLQIGGNWCPWCIKFHNFIKNNEELNAQMNVGFEVVKVNYDENNHQTELLKELDFPQRFGFPVFVILDGNGNRIHTQNSALLEQGDGYDKDKVLHFLTNWSPPALSPAFYSN
ncbi:MAG TPA: thioredoxin family protein [Draconibacterium sp.]|nr:thioredoxin family protein [Draconibacterium sp.]